MAIVRAPGDILPREESIQVQYRYLPSVIQSKEGRDLTPYGGWTTSNQIIHRSVRPSYQFGNRMRLPDGSIFVKATSYRVESQEIFLDLVPYECSFFRTSPTSSIHRGLQDTGREVGSFITRRDEFLVFGSSVPTGPKNEAIVKCLNKLGDQKVNLGENLATLHTTAGMFISKSWQIYALLTHAKLSKSWKEFTKMTAKDLRSSGILSTPAREYLTYIYGFKPLYQDLWTLHELLKEQAAKPLLLKAVGSSVRIQSPKAKELVLTNSRISSKGGESTCKVKCTLWAQFDPNHATLRTLDQLGLANPFSLAWDLVPFSFVVDWFVPVGPVLQAMSAPMGLRFMDGTISTRISETILGEYKGRTNVIDYDAIPKTEPFFERNKRVSLVHEYFDRVALNNWPLPGLYVDSNPFRADRSLKALALGVLGLQGSRSPIR